MQIEEITTKELHAQTGKFIRAATRGQKFRVTIDGQRGAILIPDDAAAETGWDEIMAEVRSLRTRAGKTDGLKIENPVLEERQRRHHAAHLR